MKCQRAKLAADERDQARARSLEACVAKFLKKQEGQIHAQVEAIVKQELEKELSKGPGKKN